LLCFGASLLTAQSLPEGPGKDVTKKICSQCHEAEVVIGKKLTKEGWSGVIDDMVSRGAMGTDEEFDKILEYLAKNFPKDTDTTKIDAKKWPFYSTLKR
jgi:hypothetical protein